MSETDTTLTMEVPTPDYDGFVSWVESEYTDNRYSQVSANKDPKTGGSVTIRSGEYPAYSRFLKDLRPRLHEHGFVIASARKDRFSTVDDHQRTHSIKAIPMLWVLAYANGNVCRRGACRHVTASGYCADCSPFFEDDENEHEPRMVNS